MYDNKSRVRLRRRAPKAGYIDKDEEKEWMNRRKRHWNVGIGRRRNAETGH